MYLLSDAGVCVVCCLVCFCRTLAYMFLSLNLFLFWSSSALTLGFEFIYRACGFFPSHYPSASNFLSSLHSTFYRRHHFFAQVYAPSVMFSRRIDVLGISKSLRLLLPLFPNFFRSSHQFHRIFSAIYRVCVGMHVRALRISDEQFF